MGISPPCPNCALEFEELAYAQSTIGPSFAIFDLLRIFASRSMRISPPCPHCALEFEELPYVEVHTGQMQMYGLPGCF